MPLPYIPYFQTTRYRVQTMIDLAEIKPGEKAADLGSGDGRIVIELAKAGSQVVGYELDEELIKLSEMNIKKAFSDFPHYVNPAQAEIQKIQLDPGSKSGMTKNITSVQNNVLPQILQKDFWLEDLSQYDIITVYPMPDIMETLEKKLLDELKPSARVLLNYYPFPNWQYETTKDHIFLYKK